MITLEESYELLNETMREWVEGAIKNLPNFVAAVLVMLAFVLGAMVAKRIAAKVFSRTFDSDVILRLATTLLQVFIICFGIFAALGALGLQRAALSMLAGAGVIGIALGFAFQDTAENLIAGIVMGVRKPFTKGDLIETHEQMGYVVRLNLRNTILENFDGQRVIIPNKDVFQNTLINYQMTGRRRVEFMVGVAYDTDLDEASKIAREALKENLEFILDDEVDALALSFGESAVDLKMRYWIQIPGDVSYYDALDRGVKTVHRAFAEAGIVIPFPIRTLEMSESSLSGLRGEPESDEAVEKGKPTQEQESSGKSESADEEAAE